MSAKNQVTPKKTTTSNTKDSRGPLGLVTPESTPEVEYGRIKADQERMAAAMRQLLVSPSTSPTNTSDKEAIRAVSDANAQSEEVKTEIDRVLRCLDSSYSDILGITPNFPEKEVVAAWRHLGCLLHPRFLKHPGADAAFKKLQTAARKLGLSDLDIDEVYYWDGEEKFDASEPNTNAIPVPSQRVADVFQEATPVLHRLGRDSSHPAIPEQPGRPDAKISGVNKTKKIAEATATTAPKTVKAAGLAAEEAPRIAGAATSAAKPSQNSIEYPWTTARAADGSLIVGVRKQGQFGTQVCIETQENDGRLIRRLESASEVGLLQVQRYWKMYGFKDLAQGQSQWSHKDRNDFDQLLWTTKSQTKLKNTAAKNKSPSADCCVKFRNKGIQILSVTSLTKVLGPSSARAEIEKVCKRDNILPPWKAGWVSQYSDPSKVEQDPARRRALRDAQANSSAHNRPGQRTQGLNGDAEKENRAVKQLEDRVRNLENEMKDMKNIAMAMNQNMETLMRMFEEVMKAK
ncbi:DnaJ domain-containing protein [Ceratocystis lukuohia]|uniref:DnaJ domain-containing protein n=1 Tax=Ceratocystis lukuohia TaxID=2019550 RepID=A0ABR4MEL4_9PEZI